MVELKKESVSVRCERETAVGYLGGDSLVAMVQASDQRDGHDSPGSHGLNGPTAMGLVADSGRIKAL